MAAHGDRFPHGVEKVWDPMEVVVARSCFSLFLCFL